MQTLLHNKSKIDGARSLPSGSAAETHAQASNRALPVNEVQHRKDRHRHDEDSHEEFFA